MTGSGAESLEVCHGITERNQKVTNSNLASHFFRRDVNEKQALTLPPFHVASHYPLTMQFSFNFILFYPRLVHTCLLIRSSPHKAGKRNMYCFNFLNKRWLILESILPFLVEVVGLEAEICRSSPFGGISKLLAIEMTRPTSSWCREMARLITCYSQIERSPEGSRQCF